MIPEEDINRVIDASDLVTIASECVVDLKQKGGRFLACCPFHKEKTPSFQIDPNLQLWHCFGCGEGGNIVTFVEKIYDMNFPEAINFLAEKANIEIHETSNKKTYSISSKGRLMEICKLTAQFYHDQLTKVNSSSADEARKYLSSREMSIDVAKKWTLGFAPGKDAITRYLLQKGFSPKDLLDANVCVKWNDGQVHDRFYERVMFPIKNLQGDVIAFGGRIMTDEQPKYLNSSENALFHKSKVLYGLDKAKVNMTASGTAIVVEGYTDVIALHEAGINYAVATLGTALTKHHIRMLNQHAKKKIVYLFDGDEAGQRAAERALNFIDQIERPEVYAKRAELVALTLPDNLDPKEFIDKHGKDNLLALIDKAKPLLLYGIERKISAYDLTLPGNKARAASAALKVLAPIKDSLIAKEYAATIAGKTGMRQEDLISELGKLKPQKSFDNDEQLHKKQFEPQKHFAQSKNKPPLSLEKELLCFFANYPQHINDVLNDDFSYNWSSKSHENLFNYIMQAIKENPKISARMLILKVSQKNPQTANMLTGISNLYDFKSNPAYHGKFLLYSLKLEQISTHIEDLKFKFNNMENGKDKDDLFKQIVELQNQQKQLIAKKKELI